MISATSPGRSGGRCTRRCIDGCARPAPGRSSTTSSSPSRRSDCDDDLALLRRGRARAGHDPRDRRDRRRGDHARARRRRRHLRRRWRDRRGRATSPTDPGGVRSDRYAAGAHDRHRDCGAWSTSSPSRFTEDGTALIDFRGPPGTIPTYSFARRHRGSRPGRGAARPDRRRRRDRADLQDVHATPAGWRADGRAGDPGQRDLDRTARQPAARARRATFGFAALLALGLAAGWRRASGARSAGAAAASALGALYAVGAQLAFDHADGPARRAAAAWP